VSNDVAAELQADRIRALVKSLATTTTIPSKRSNKNRSGRSGVKAAHGRAWVAAVGGTTDLTKAIYAPADKHLCRTYEEWVAAGRK
jgi:hypothetical protein